MTPNMAPSIFGSWGFIEIRNLLLIIFFALLLRLITYNGVLGSDDLVYFERAAELARGEWRSSNYNGALRYGFNLPAAVFIALFGESMFIANLWPLTCSLIEIGAVFVFANAAMSHRAGIFAALLLATAPLHISVATRIHADPVVSMFITLGFVLIYFAVIQRRMVLFFAAGLCIGGIFWTKELAAVTWLAFLPMLYFFRGHWRNVFYIIAGALFMMLLHGILMVAIAGDPLHLIKVVLSAVKRNFVDGGDGEDAAAYYLRYLFIDLRHVGVIAFFAVASTILLPHLMKTQPEQHSGFIFTLIWWLALLLVLSIFPVSLSPLRFTLKQSNYITLFLAPTAILAGMALANLTLVRGRFLLLLGMSFGMLLGLLQQADYRALTANSKALASFAILHPKAVIVGSTNNNRLRNYFRREMYPGSTMAVITSFRKLTEGDEVSREQLRDAESIFAVLDRQTMTWAAGKTPITRALPCWRFEQTLMVEGLGFGNAFAKMASEVLGFVKPLANALRNLATPQNADVFRVTGSDVFCGLSE